jgi:alpha-ketoglutarate-dependent taurine dioxygenase
MKQQSCDCGVSTDGDGVMSQTGIERLELDNDERVAYLGPLDPNSTLPWLVEARVKGDARCDLVRLFRDHEREVRQWLLKKGAVLFRGFGIDSSSLFADFTQSVCPTLLDAMEENVPRRRLTTGVYTSSEYPADCRISLHSEYSYALAWPAKLFFCCILPAKQGGSTPLIDNRTVLKLLDKEVVAQFSRKKTKYYRNLHGGAGFGVSWQESFQTDERSVVEQYGKSHALDVHWKADGGLRLAQIRPGIIDHPITHEAVWFNQAPQFHASDYPQGVYSAMLNLFKDDERAMPHFVCFDDETPIDVATLNHIRETMYRHATSFAWEKGDVLVLDNILVSHGRTPFVGPRKVLVAMSSS